MYQTEPEPGLNGRQVFQPRGKVLGGSSSINGLLYVRGQHEDFDRWRQHGNTGWGYDDVSALFQTGRRTSSAAPTNFTARAARCRCRIWRHARSTVGGVHCTRRPRSAFPPTPTSTARPRRARACSRPRRDAAGAPATARSRICDRRWSRGNLQVETSALAQRILFDGNAAPEALPTGRTGCCAPREARKEVLVSSGAYNSPQLLQLSGVGPADLLKQHGIDVVLDAPGVGNDLQDHMQVRIVMRCAQPITLNDIVNHPVRRILAGLRYAALRTGPLTIAAGTAGRVLQDQSAAGVARTSRSISCRSRPTRWARSCIPFRASRASVCQLRPESRGSLRIRSADPTRAAGNPDQLPRNRNRSPRHSSKA